MPTPNIPHPKFSLVEKPKTHLPLWLIIMIILTLAISASALICLFTTKKPSANLPAINPAVKTDNFPAVINSYVGKIIAIANSEFTLAAPAAKNYLSQDKTLTIKISDKTVLTALTLPKTVTDPSKPLIIGKKLIAFKDLKIGDEVVVFAVENLKNKTVIAADSVEVQNIK